MAQRMLVIGLGTSGARICEDLVRKIEAEFGGLERTPWLRVAAFDTKAVAGSYLGERDCAHHIGLKQEDYGKLLQHPNTFESIRLTEWADTGVLGKTNAADDGAGNVRMIGRACWMHPNTMSTFHAVITMHLNRLETLKEAEALEARGRLPNGENPPVALSSRVTVFVCGSLTGGTSGGAFIDIGYYLRTLSGHDLDVRGLFTIPHPAMPTMPAKANAYASLMELNHFHKDGCEYRAKFANRITETVVRSQTPYASVFICRPKGGSEGMASGDPIPTMETALGTFLFLASFPQFIENVWGELVDPGVLYKQMKDRWGNYSFATLGLASVEFPAEHVMRGCCNRLCSDTLDALLNRQPPWDEAAVGLQVRTTLGLDREKLQDDLLRMNGEQGGDLRSRIQSQSRAAADKAKSGDLEGLSYARDQIALGFAHKSDQVPAAEDIPVGLFVDTIQANGRRVVRERIEAAQRMFREGMLDLDRGPNWCLAAASALERDCAELLDVLGQPIDLEYYESAVDEVADHFEDALGSTLLRLLFWKGLAVSHLAKRYLEASESYWDSRLLMLCAACEADVCRELMALAQRTTKRLKSTEYGSIDWLRRLQQRLADEHHRLDTQPPSVNGRLLFRPGETIDEQYGRCLEGVRNPGDPDVSPGIRGGAEYVMRRLLRDWTWLGEQLVTSSSVFEKPSSPDAASKLPVSEPMYRSFLDLARSWFLDLFSRSAVDDLYAIDNPRAAISDLKEQAAKFLDISDEKIRLGPPAGHEDRRLPRFAFFHGAGVEPGEDTNEARLVRDLRDHVKHPVHVDEKHRIVLVEARSTFPIAAVHGLDPEGDNSFEDAFRHEAKEQGHSLHSRKDIRWKPIYKPLGGDVNRDLAVAHLLVGVATGVVEGGGLAGFRLKYPAVSITEPGGAVSLPNRLEDAAEEVLSRPAAGNHLRTRLDEIRHEPGIDWMADQIIELLHKRLSVLDISLEGKPLDARIGYALMYPYLQQIPGLIEAITARFRDATPPQPEDYLVREPSQMNEKRPVPGYYCPNCDAYLAAENSPELVPKACPSCGLRLLL